MKSSMKFVCGVVVVGVCMLVNISGAYAEHRIAGEDWQYWHETTIEFGILNNLDGHVKCEQQFIDDFSKFNTYNLTPGVVYSFNEKYSLEVNYKYEKEKDGDIWVREHRFEFAPIVKWKVDRFNIKLKNQLEYRDLEDENQWRIKEQLKVGTDTAIGSFNFTVFAANEVYYVFKDHQINQNRAMVGLEKEIMSNVEFVVYYMYAAKKKNGDWSGAHVLDTEITIKL